MYKNSAKLNPEQSFQLFCLESYRSAKSISGLKAFTEFKQAKVFDFLTSGYEVLHTQSKNYLIAEITDYINLHHATISRKH